MDGDSAKALIWSWWKIVRRSVVEFLAAKPLRYSSSIAFYLIFSLPAVLLIATAVAGAAFEDAVVRQNILNEVRTLYGESSAETVDEILTNASKVGTNFWARAIGIGTLIFSATTVFIALQDGLNSIWGLAPNPEGHRLNFLRDRLISLAMVVSTGFLLLVSLTLDAALALFQSFLTDLFSAVGFYLMAILNFLASLTIVTLIFALIFKVLPDASVRWRDVWTGALVTAVLFTLGKYLIGLYLGNSAIANVYGAAGSLVVILVWVFYSSIIVLFGAEFTYVYMRETGTPIRPYPHAVFVQKIEVKPEKPATQA